MPCPCLNRTSATRVKVSWTTIILTGNINNIVVSANTSTYCYLICSPIVIHTIFKNRCYLYRLSNLTEQAVSLSLSNGSLFRYKVRSNYLYLITGGVEPPSVPTLVVSLMSPFCYQHIYYIIYCLFNQLIILPFTIKIYEFNRTIFYS